MESHYNRSASDWRVVDRKRKAAAMDHPMRDDLLTTRPSRKEFQRNLPPALHLGTMISPERLSKDNYTHVQKTLWEQNAAIQAREKIIAERDEKILEQKDLIAAQDNSIFRNEQDCKAYEQECRNLESRVRGLETQLERARANSDSIAKENMRLKDDQRARESSVKHLRERKHHLETQLEEKNQWMAMGTKALDEKTSEVKRLEGESARLSRLVTERDSTVSKLNEQIMHIGNAPAHEITSVMLEAQASRTLGLVNGLKEDVAREQSKAKGLETQIESMNGVIRTQNQAKVDQQREVEGLKRALSKQESIAEAVTQRAKDAKEVT